MRLTLELYAFAITIMLLGVISRCTICILTCRNFSAATSWMKMLQTVLLLKLKLFWPSVTALPGPGPCPASIRSVPAPAPPIATTPEMDPAPSAFWPDAAPAVVDAERLI